MARQDAQGGNETGANKPNATSQKTDELVNEILQRLGIGSAASSVVSEAEAPYLMDAKASAGTPAEARTSVGAPPAPASLTTRSSNRTVEVNCRPCGGCCGRVRGVRLPIDVYEFVGQVASALGVRVCDVVNRLCPVLGRDRARGGLRTHSLDEVKRIEKFISRAGIYKPGYVVVRLRDAPDVRLVKSLLIMALRDEYVLNELDKYIDGVGTLDLPDLHGFANHEFVRNLVNELGFDSIDGLALYIKAVIDGLLWIGAVAKSGKVSMDDVREVTCLICGESIPATGLTTEFIKSLIKHFREAHGLRTVDDINRAAAQVAERYMHDFVPRAHPSLKIMLVDWLVDVVLMNVQALGILRRTESGQYVCEKCGVTLGDKHDVIEHLYTVHRVDILSMLSQSVLGRKQAQATIQQAPAQQPQTTAAPTQADKPQQGSGEPPLRVIKRVEAKAESAKSASEENWRDILSPMVRRNIDFVVPLEQLFPQRHNRPE
ncbi:hypothetical protein [Vulcanisaeta distributa]|uniref:hypothetical protein n=1 Tax=Vulcanisaeta distributa TaxID=164451 RepID=UPI0006D0A762|nr:hypothetical protein [Vulcanisaeta distributa]